MKFNFICALLFFLSLSEGYSQGVFESAGNGRWQDAGTWTLVSGSDANGRPDSDDQVTILSGHNITIQANQQCDNLTFDGGQISFNNDRTVSVGGNLSVISNSSMSGYSNNHIFEVAGNMTINTGVTFAVGALSFTINGTSTINGDLDITGYGAKPRNFGDINITSSGSMTCSGADAYTFNGDLTNNGSFTATSFGTTFDFTSSSGTIGGSGLLSFFEVTFDSPANYTNEGNLQIRDNMTGTGSFTNGDGGELELQNGGPFTVSTFDASATGNTITYTGFGSPTGFSGSYYNLVLNKSSGTLGFSGAPSILNDLTIDSGIFQVGAVTVTIGNNLNLNGGEFTPDNASAVINIGGDMNITGGEYDHNNGDVNVTGNILVSGGDFFLNGAGSTIDAGSVSLEGVALTLSQGTWSTTGNFDVETGSSITGNGAVIDIDGTFNFNSGATANFTGGSLLSNSIYVGAGNELFINAVNLTSNGQVELDGTITFNNGTGTKQVGSILVNVSGNWNVTQPLNITVSGDITNNGIFTGDPGYGTSTYTLSSTSGTIGGSNPITIRDVLINSPGSYTNEGTLTVGSTLRGTGSFTNGANATFTYRGNNSSGTNFNITNFTASATGNTVIYAAGTYNQQWRATTSATNDYFNVTIQTAAGDYQNILLAADVRVNGTLTIVEGFVRLGSFDLELAAGVTISGGDASNYIRLNGTGVVRQYYSSLGATTFYPIGDNNNYSPITSFTINSATLGANPYVDIDVIDANHPNRNTGNIGLGGNDDGVAAVDYISRYWNLTGNDLTGPSYNVSYQYIDGDITGTESNMIGALYGQPPGETFSDWKETGTVNATNNTASISDADYWGDVYAMDNNLDRLPVELINFEGRSLESEVVLKWSTASEEGNSHFVIERSGDGKVYKEIKSVAGAGTSTGLQEYSVRDSSPLNGRSYYRLKQVDFNGNFTFSKLIAIEFEGKEFELDVKVYPNPAQANEPISIIFQEGLSVNEPISMRVINKMGQIVWSHIVNTDNTTPIQFSVDQMGTYVLQITSSKKKVVKKLIVR